MSSEMMKIPTPSLSHLSSGDYDQVYEPAEDSFLLLDALEKELPVLQRLEPQICIEVGSGSGILAVGLANALKGAFVIATDVNRIACQKSLETGAKNGCQFIDVVRSRSLSGLAHRLNGLVDILLCNPPYVCTSDSEATSDDITASWAGGEAGLNVTNTVISLLPHLLSPEKGRAYVIVEQKNNLNDVVENVQTFGLKSEIAMTRRAGIEVLSVLKIWK